MFRLDNLRAIYCLFIIFVFNFHDVFSLSFASYCYISTFYAVYSKSHSNITAHLNFHFIDFLITSLLNYFSYIFGIVLRQISW